MKREFFYLKDGNKLDIMDVGRLASLALVLEPISEITEIAGYYGSLSKYMNENKDNLLFNSFALLNSDHCGKSLLLSNIGLLLLEREFREKGATENSIKSYVNIVNEYHRIINTNREMYEQPPIIK